MSSRAFAQALKFGVPLILALFLANAVAADTCPLGCGDGLDVDDKRFWCEDLVGSSMFCDPTCLDVGGDTLGCSASGLTGCRHCRYNCDGYGLCTLCPPDAYDFSDYCDTITAAPTSGPTWAPTPAPTPYELCPLGCGDGIDVDHKIFFCEVGLSMFCDPTCLDAGVDTTGCDAFGLAGCRYCTYSCDGDGSSCILCPPNAYDFSDYCSTPAAPTSAPTWAPTGSEPTWAPTWAPTGSESTWAPTWAPTGSESTWAPTPSWTWAPTTARTFAPTLPGPEEICVSADQCANELDYADKEMLCLYDASFYCDVASCSNGDPFCGLGSTFGCRVCWNDCEDREAAGKWCISCPENVPDFSGYCRGPTASPTAAPSPSETWAPTPAATWAPTGSEPTWAPTYAPTLSGPEEICVSADQCAYGNDLDYFDKEELCLNNASVYCDASCSNYDPFCGQYGIFGCRVCSLDCDVHEAAGQGCITCPKIVPDFSGYCRGPTASPTAAPSPSLDTPSPTAAPFFFPRTPAPTAAPLFDGRTPAPTAAPFFDGPTPEPSSAPTAKPSVNHDTPPPTFSPTGEETPMPTSQPSISGTAGPTAAPTTTASPTAVPTSGVVATNKPTSPPSATCDPRCVNTGVAKSRACDSSCLGAAPSYGGQFCNFNNLGQECRACYNDLKQATKVVERGELALMCNTFAPPEGITTQPSPAPVATLQPTAMPTTVGGTPAPTPLTTGKPSSAPSPTCNPRCPKDFGAKGRACDPGCLGSDPSYGGEFCNFNNLGQECRSCFNSLAQAKKVQQTGKLALMCDTFAPSE